MIRVSAMFLSLAAAFATAASAAPKFATVRIADVYRGLASTRALNESLDLERRAIIDDERAIHLRKILEELRQLNEELQKKRAAPVDDTTRKLAQAFELKRQEAQTLQQEFQIFEAGKKKEINGKMVAGMRASLAKITATAQRLAGEQGYDCAFDVSGNSNSSVPVILYSKTAKDLTEDVVAALKDEGEPTAPPASSNPAPAPQEPAPVPVTPPATAKP